jgi:hypothetical protein
MGSLRQLYLGGISSSFAAGLTQLTSLSLGSNQEPPSQRLANISAVTQLQYLEYQAAWGAHGCLADGLVKHICTTFTQLRSLALRGIVSQADFDVLLAHGTHLTHLTVGDLEYCEDRSASPCSWKELAVEKQQSEIRMLGWLPLHSLTRLRFSGWDLPYARPSLSGVTRATADSLASTQHALANLATCPAWNSCPGMYVEVTGVGVDSWGLDHSQVLAAMCTSAHKQVQQLRISDFESILTAPDLEALGRVVGSSLTHLELVGCPVSSDFWPAVWVHLPVLQALSLSDRSGSPLNPEDLQAFRTSAPRPLELQLCDSLHTRFLQSERPQEQQVTGHGKPLVTVTVWREDQ